MGESKAAIPSSAEGKTTEFGEFVDESFAAADNNKADHHVESETSDIFLNKSEQEDANSQVCN